jgi:hypothetical protein
MTEDRERYILEQLRAIRISVEITAAVVFLFAIVRALSWLWMNFLAA